MINLESIFRNIFATSSISDDNMKTFCETHIARIVANNTGGMFSAMLTATGTVYVSYFGKMSSEETKFSIQQSLTIANDTLIENFKKDVSKTEGFIKFKYDKGSTVYEEFFPHGLTEFSTATKGNVETLATRFFNACDAHSADFPADTVTLFENYKENLPATRMAQLTKIGEVSFEKAGTAAARTALEIQLNANIHFIGFTFPTNVTQCMTFFDQSIVRRAVNHSTDGIGQVAGIVTNAADEPLEGVKIHISTASVADRNTKADGSYKSPNVPVGEHTLRISKDGYVTQYIDVDVKDDGVTTLDIKMVAAV